MLLLYFCVQTEAGIRYAHELLEFRRGLFRSGAPLIGATAAYGVCLAVRNDDGDEARDLACETLFATRPTAVNLRWALDEMRAALRNRPRDERVAAAYARAAEICDEDVAICQAIGRHGLKIIREIAATKADCEAVNILPHSNAGWLATGGWGTATAPQQQI